MQSNEVNKNFAELDSDDDTETVGHTTFRTAKNKSEVSNASEKSQNPKK